MTNITLTRASTAALGDVAQLAAIPAADMLDFAAPKFLRVREAGAVDG